MNFNNLRKIAGTIACIILGAATAVVAGLAGNPWLVVALGFILYLLVGRLAGLIHAGTHNKQTKQTKEK